MADIGAKEQGAIEYLDVLIRIIEGITKLIGDDSQDATLTLIRAHQEQLRDGLTIAEMKVLQSQVIGMFELGLKGKQS